MKLIRINEDMGMNESVRSLSAFKRYLKGGGRLKLVKHEIMVDGSARDVTKFHPAYNVVRIPTKVQSNGFWLASEDNLSNSSFMAFGKSSTWEFDDNLAISNDDGTVLVYEMVDD